MEEIKRVNKMKFDFLQKTQGMNYCSRIAKNLHKRKMEEVLVFPYLMEEYRPELINNYLQQLRTDNLIIFAESKEFEPDCTIEEPIYKCKYIIVPNEEITPLPCDVSLPEKNQFIPDDLTLKPLGESHFPRKLYESALVEAFFKEDH